MIEFLNMDYVDYVVNLPDKALQLAVEDPEWGVGASKPTIKPNKVKQRSGKIMSIKQFDKAPREWDNLPATVEYFNHIKRISENQIIWGANFFEWIVGEGKIFKPPRREEFSEFIKKYPTGWILWDKLNGGSDQWDCELAWTSFDRPTVIYEFMWSGMHQGSKANGKIQEGNKKLNEKRIHPTQKPTQLYRWILLNYAKNVGGKIIDTHGGSFSSAIAADMEGFDMVIIEKDKGYFDDGIKRFNDYKKQLNIFS